MLTVTGYVDRWSAHAGEELTFFVSASTPQFRAVLHRLIQGDPSPRAPGVKEERIDHPLNAEVRAGIDQAILPGSCMLVEQAPATTRFVIAGAFQPTLFGEPNGLIGVTLNDGSTLAVLVDASGLALHLGTTEVARTGRPLLAGQWYDVMLDVDLAADRVALACRAFAYEPGSSVDLAEVRLQGDPPGPLLSLCVGAASCQRADRQWHVAAPFNGRVADLRLFVDIAADAAVTAWREHREPAEHASAAWRFVEEAGSEIVPDGIDRRYDGRTINRPTRLVAGPRFEGQAQRATDAPDLFNAIHFHDDDLGDAGWTPSFTFTVPDDLRSGIYAFKLTAGDGTDYIPFVVTPAPGRAVAPVAVLVPTLSYQIYANLYAELDQLPPSESPLRDMALPETAEEAYVRVQRLRSCYDVHGDGSGVCLASLLRPMPIFVRPNSLGRLNNSQHQLSADLYLIDWLEAKGIAYETVTDHELHAGGAGVLSRFRTVLTGTHAEYWTATMLDGLKNYTDDGGRFICLAGNGLYWATAISDDGTMAETRRDHGLRSWTSLPGEAQLSLDGSMGGVWRSLGRAPNRYTGVGFTAMGFDLGRPYTRLDASRASRAAFLFDGIDDDAIGDFPSLISGYGAAGVEFDRADVAQGTPAHAIVLASATGFSDLYQLTIDDVVTTSRFYGGTLHPDVRADMVFYETPKGGAVFSAASISWCGCLSHNGYDNSVSRLTENVVRCFMREHLPDAIAGAALLPAEQRDVRAQPQEPPATLPAA